MKLKSELQISICSYVKQLVDSVVLHVFVDAFNGLVVLRADAHLVHLKFHLVELLGLLSHWGARGGGCMSAHCRRSHLYSNF